MVVLRCVPCGAGKSIDPKVMQPDKDLEKLEKEDLIVREHGGAYLKNVRDQVKAFSLVHQENLDKKELIAKKCLEFIESGDTIILDSGSTTTEIAKKLKGKKDLTVITNALNIALMLGAEPGIKLPTSSKTFTYKNYFWLPPAFHLKRV